MLNPQIEIFFHQHHIPYQSQVPLRDYCTYKIGGPAEFMVFPENPDQIHSLILLIRENQIPFFLLGGGSNVLFDDRGFRGIVISTYRLNRISSTRDSILVQSGCRMDQLTHYCSRHGLSGLEFAGGLPGSLGGAVTMNARCYGGEFSQIVNHITALDLSGRWLDYTHPECGFDYKDSVFQHNQAIILECRLSLTPNRPDLVKAKTEANLRDREQKNQFQYPSAGCIFKNNYTLGIPSGKLIEELGLKGYRRNDIEIYTCHANFFINHGTGKSEDVRFLIDMVRTRIEQHYHTRLEQEVIVVPY